MATARCGIIELAPDHEGALNEWVDYMERHRDEVRALFAQAGVALESFFVASLDGKVLLVSYIRIVDEDRAHRAHLEAASSDDPTTRVNERFKRVAWRAVHEAKLVFDAEAASG